MESMNTNMKIVIIRYYQSWVW